MGSARGICVCIAQRAACFAAAISVVGALHADTFNYPDYVGNTVKYSMITEVTDSPNVDTTTGTTFGLFGGVAGPTGVADSLDFAPIFSQQSSGTGDMDTKESTLSTMIESLPGSFIGALKFNEGGDVSLLGAGAAGTFASVEAQFDVEIAAVDGVLLGTPIQLSLSMNMTPSDGNFDLATDAGGLPFYNENWKGELVVDLTQALIDAGQSFNAGATKVNVSLSNVLMTKSENGTTSFIAKKDFGGTSISAVAPPIIPLPTTLALGILGLLGVAGWNRSLKR